MRLNVRQNTNTASLAHEYDIFGRRIQYHWHTNTICFLHVLKHALQSCKNDKANRGNTVDNCLYWHLYVNQSYTVNRKFRLLTIHYNLVDDHSVVNGFYCKPVFFGTTYRQHYAAQGLVAHHVFLPLV